VLLIAGTSSGAGKSLVVTGCAGRWLAGGSLSRRFKAQNMSNNSCVCPDGAEIGRPNICRLKLRSFRRNRQ
jgi:adenosylcobyric acid synthase